MKGRRQTHNVGEDENREEGDLPAKSIGEEPSRELTDDLEAGKDARPAEGKSA